MTVRLLKKSHKLFPSVIGIKNHLTSGQLNYPVTETTENSKLNFHQSCAYPKIICDHKGKEKHIYLQENYMVPYEKLKLLSNLELRNV